MSLYVSSKDALAMALFMFEGARLCKADVACIRNNNPGNLRPYKGGQVADEKNRRIFTSFIEGWQALLDDIQHKINSHPEIVTLLDFLNKYAPAGDNNNPTEYALFVAHWLSIALDQSITIKDNFRQIMNIRPSV